MNTSDTPGGQGEADELHLREVIRYLLPQVGHEYVTFEQKKPEGYTLLDGRLEAIENELIKAVQRYSHHQTADSIERLLIQEETLYIRDEPGSVQLQAMQSRVIKEAAERIRKGEQI